MNFKQRLPYFLIGLFIGTMIAVFVFKKKNTSFDYMPNARVLKDIRTKKRLFTSEAINELKKHQIDTSAISVILQNGDVDLWNKKRLDTCIQYDIQGENPYENITLTVKNSDSIAVIERVSFRK